MTAAREANSASWRVVGAMRTDVGRVRSLNEDTVAFVAPDEKDPEAKRGLLALVADGMGGHAAGEVASALAAEVVRRVYFSLDRPPLEALRAAFEAANRAILDYAAKHPDCAGMGTTCTALAVRDECLWLAHVGDSRAYILRDGQLTQLSEDQTLHAQLVRDGVLTAEEAEKAPGGNVILQALGTRQEISPDLWSEGMRLRLGDRFILCSDGLSNLASDADIARIVSRHPPREACAALIDAALAAGGYDNISVGVFAVERAAPNQSSGQAATQRINIADSPTGASTTKIEAIVEG
ncbi:PP2C family protein-serine/threonine phosphatase [Methylocystis sp.]|uniref:PP2C family protein-serine/threonine phosphatase n=1 Tax=Methylocystis sp. TaxID=1911079 RepID=UPI003D0B0A43